MTAPLFATIAYKARQLWFACQSIGYRGQPSIMDQIAQRRRRWHDTGRPARLKPTSGKPAGQTYVRHLGYQVPRPIALLDRITDLPELAVLGPRFVLKPVDSHSSRNVFAMQDGVNLIGGQAMSRADIIRKVGADATSAFLVEELLQDWSGGTGLPMDYKFFCFGHNVVLLHVIERHSATDPDLNRQWFLTPDFEPLGFPVYCRVARCPGLPPKPPIYPAMLDMARAIASGLNAFVRVDLYATPRGPVFGELTPFPHGGIGFTPRANAFLGRFWRGQEGCGD